MLPTVSPPPHVEVMVLLINFSHFLVEYCVDYLSSCISQELHTSTVGVGAGRHTSSLVMKGWHVLFLGGTR